MEGEVQKRKVIYNIRNEIEGSNGTRIWSDHVNALKLISQVVFTRSSGFILEIIQNAEDAGIGSERPGELEIRINKERVKISHNGRPFSAEDVKAVCGIRSSKKPERGTLGYLGIGFKSVFKVTDRPEIYSNGFQFKFDRDAWPDPSNAPWHVIPMWVKTPSEKVAENRTTFIVPFREEERKGSTYSALSQELRKLGIELYLFLRWLKKIEIIDEVSEETLDIENMGVTGKGIATLQRNGREQKFKFFHKTVEVPEWVKTDRLTQEYRVNVAKREISIAFALDGHGNLAPSAAGAMYGGVYSFLPLGEAKSGARFPIQADFLVQPGRDAINYEAKWNHWLLGEVTSLCKKSIRFFKTHEKWKYQFLPAFEFNKSRGLEAYDKLFGPILAEPIEKFLKENGCVPTWDGGWAELDQTVCLNESSGATNELIQMGILKEDEIATIAGGRSGLKLVHPDVKERYSHPFKKVDRQDLLGNDGFLEEKSWQPDAPAWFRTLYLWLAKNPVYYKSGRSHYIKGYHEFKFVLTAKRNILNGGDVWLPDVSPADPIGKGLADTLKKSRNVLHPDILAGAKDEQEAKILRGFLIGHAGVQVLDSSTVLKLSFGQEIGTKAVGYIRVSTEEQAREGISLENQRTKIEAYCSLNDLDLVEILEDAGKSGKDLNRDGVRRVIDLVRGREIDAVVVYKLDRLSRRVKDTLTILDAIDKKSIAFHSIMEKIDTKSAMGRFFLNIMASMNQWERDTIAERTKDALRLKILKNERAGQVPYGWRLAEDGKTLVENSLEQRAISLVRNLDAKGYSLRAICRELEKEGYEPIGKRWHPKTVRSILKKAA